MITQLCILLLLLLPSGTLLTRHLKNHHHPRTRRKTAVVLVLGDIGRSPRMMYHAQSLVRSGFKVWLVGYSGTPPLSSLQSSPDVSIHYIPSPPDFLNTIRLPFLVAGPAKVIFQVIGMLKILLRYPTSLGAEFLLVQNPPAIPTLLLAQVISFVRGSKLVIDWHNTGYSILALKLGNGHLLVKLARWFEKTFGRTAYAHLFVTDAMQKTLSKNWELQGQKVVLHDRPPEHFRQSTPAEIHELFDRLLPTLSPPLPPKMNTRNLLTTSSSSSSTIEMRPDRPAVVVSSTSWTPDEDFTVLVSALDEYQRLLTSPPPPSAEHRDALPALLVLVSGKGGPLLSSFLSTVSAREKTHQWPDITVRTTWLAMPDYPVFLGSADLGVSLHASSSGLDLPMKVVDLFGCGVPVLARGFKWCVTFGWLKATATDAASWFFNDDDSLDELVKDGENGRIFHTPADLARQLAETLQGFPHAPKLQTLRDYFVPSDGRDGRDGRRQAWSSWDEQWVRVVGPVLSKKDQ